jgi:hypothetical protein
MHDLDPPCAALIPQFVELPQRGAAPHSKVDGSLEYLAGGPKVLWLSPQGGQVRHQGMGAPGASQGQDGIAAATPGNRDGQVKDRDRSLWQFGGHFGMHSALA